MAAAAVLYVTDMGRMGAFYESCFAMSGRPADGEGFRILSSSDWELSLVRVPPSIADTIAITDPPPRRGDVPVKLAFEVSDITTVASMIVAAGGQVEPCESAWDFGGRRHRDFVDPEGNVGQLRQSLTM
jgi:hypothetical protein